ncbi:MAG: Mu-like prophage major head subunit gpT family protein, partial [Pirellulales bacterium]
MSTAKEGLQLRLEATPDFTAGQDGKDGPPRFTMQAYTGGLIQVQAYPSVVVVDLAGLAIPDSVPILADHRPQAPLGHAVARVRDGKLLADGTLSVPGDLTERVRGGARNGFPWRASIGASVVKARKLPAGETAEVNGRTVRAPDEGAYIIERASLNEISILALAADGETSVAVRGELGGQTMLDADQTDETKTADEIRAEAAAEAQRVADIRARVGDRQPAIVAEAIREGWTPDQAELAVIRAERPTAPRASTGTSAALSAKSLEAGILMRAGRPDLAEQLGDAAASAGERFRHVADIAAAACDLDGRSVTGQGPGALFQAAFSTVSMPQALGGASQRILADAFEDQPALWREIAAVRDVPDLLPHTILRDTDVGGFQEIAPTGEVKLGAVDEESLPTVRAETFGENLTFSRRALINDDLGAIAQLAEGLGRNAARKLNDLVGQAIRANADSFFSNGNSNNLTGADSALSFDSLAEAVQKMKEQTDSAGDPIDVRPKFLIVPPALEMTARQLVVSDAMARHTESGTDNVPAGNPMFDQLTPLTEARLGAGYDGGSDVAWYLFAQKSA